MRKSATRSMLITQHSALSLGLASLNCELPILTLKLFLTVKARVALAALAVATTMIVTQIAHRQRATTSALNYHSTL